MGLVRTQNSKYLSLECLLAFSDLLAAKKAISKAGSLREYAVAWLLIGPSGYVTAAYIRLSAWTEVVDIIESRGDVRKRNPGFLSSCVALSAQVSMSTFTVYSATGNTLTAPVVFPAIALFTALRFPLSFLPMIIASTAKMLVGVQRITDFLVADEIPPRQEGTGAMLLTLYGAHLAVSEGTVAMNSGMDRSMRSQLYKV
jgi:hypothetical protein